MIEEASPMVQLVSGVSARRPVLPSALPCGPCWVPSDGAVALRFPQFPFAPKLGGGITDTFLLL